MLEDHPAAVPSEDLPHSCWAADEAATQLPREHAASVTCRRAAIAPHAHLNRDTNAAQSSRRAGGSPLSPCQWFTLGSRASPALCHLRCHPSTSWAPQRSNLGRPQAYSPSAVHCCSCIHTTGPPSGPSCQWHHAVNMGPVLGNRRIEIGLPNIV